MQLRVSFNQSLATSVLLRAAIAEEVAVLRVTQVVTFVAHSCADRAHSDPVQHATGVAVVPVLVHELLLRDRERAQLVAQRVLVGVLAAVFVVVYFIRPICLLIERSLPYNKYIII